MIICRFLRKIPHFVHSSCRFFKYRSVILPFLSPEGLFAVGFWVTAGRFLFQNLLLPHFIADGKTSGRISRKGIAGCFAMELFLSTRLVENSGSEVGKSTSRQIGKTASFARTRVFLVITFCFHCLRKTAQNTEHQKVYGEGK